MTTIMARFNVLPGKEAEAEEAMRQMASAVESNEPGARTYIFHRSAKNPAEITVFEMYADDQAAGVHAGSEHMAKFRTHFGALFDPATVKIEKLDRIAGFSR